MRRLAGLVDENAEELAVAEVRDNGKLLREMRGQMEALPQYYEYFAGAADKIGGDVIGSSKPNFFVYQLLEPVGVVGAITSWNSPLLIAAYKLAPGLAAGCTFVLKPSEHTSVSTILFARLVEEAGFPPGVLNVVTGDGPNVGEPLVSNPGVDKIAFTGSTVTGMRVASAAASHLAKVSLELGGKSPNIVFADADLDAAASGVIAGIFAACGQSCVAGSRLLVQRSVHDELLSRIVDRTAAITIGNPMDLETEMGPLAFQAHYDRVVSFVDVGLDEGAELIFGGKRPDHLPEGLFLEPTIFDRVENGMRIAQEEIFGPVLSVISFEGEDEAVRLANDSSHGLAAGVWTRDIQRGHRLAKAIQAGTVWLNAYRMVSHDVPFGGYKASGYGRENGLEGLREYQQTKTVWVETEGLVRDPFRLG
jgi:aldehyde dehydrogenase (NAD+)